MEFGKRLDAPRSFRPGLRDFNDNYIAKGWQPKTDNGQAYWEDGVGNRVYIADTTSAAVTITLPSADASTGVYYTIKRTTGGLNALKVVALSGNFDGTPTYSVSNVQYSTVRFFCDGAQYWIV